jgi:transcriptional regulator with PAS, ATPase and Fis domain
MSSAVELVQRVAPTEATVLITGESGTGKEVLARQVHLLSERRKAPYVAVNCGALSSTLLESQLFGHERGAFTGASNQHPGLFQQASGGTLFLDEIGELSPTSQVTLLRVLQEGTVRPLGGTSERTVNVRVVAATHQNLKKMVEDGEFRADLFYRINVFAIHIPPLRRRPEDVLPLAILLLEKHAQRLRVPVPRLDGATLDFLQAHPWFGNVRELENVLERALILQTNGIITPSCLPSDVTESQASPHQGDPQGTFAEAKLLFEREYLQVSLDRAGGNLSEAARLAGLDRSNLRRMLKKHELLD